MIFQVAGPLVGAPAAQIWQKGLAVVSVLDPPKRGPAAPDFRFAPFRAAWLGPLFVP